MLKNTLTFLVGSTRVNRTVTALKEYFRTKVVGYTSRTDGGAVVHAPDPACAKILGLKVPVDMTLTQVAFPTASPTQVLASDYTRSIVVSYPFTTRSLVVSCTRSVLVQCSFSARSVLVSC